MSQNNGSSVSMSKMGFIRLLLKATRKAWRPAAVLVPLCSLQAWVSEQEGRGQAAVTILAEQQQQSVPGVDEQNLCKGVQAAFSEALQIDNSDRVLDVHVALSLS